MSVTANRPAENRACVLFGVDAGFFPFALQLADQICRAFPDRTFDVAIAGFEPLPDHPLVAAHGIRLLTLDVDTQGLETDSRYRIESFLPILAPRALAQDYDRLLFLDADILYLRGDIPALLSLDMGAQCLAAVLDNHQMRSPSRVPREFKLAGLGHAKYFNSGVLLIDVPAFTGREVDRTAIGFARAHNGKFKYTDQGALNVALHGDWLELPAVWNFPGHPKYALMRHFADPCFLHYFGPNKPWNARNGLIARADVGHFRRFLAAHFPELAAKVPDPGPIGDKTGIWRAIQLRGLIDQPRTARYLDRFASDFDVKRD